METSARTEKRNLCGKRNFVREKKSKIIHSTEKLAVEAVN
jgi:hypothetical protein